MDIHIWYALGHAQIIFLILNPSGSTVGNRLLFMAVLGAKNSIVNKLNNEYFTSIILHKQRLNHAPNPYESNNLQL